ncbi:hypothetical protein PHLGIDRAFT_68979 [Phlebiopsis gigantea 11061_1 CR5-6]|uniref:RNase H type-1 domain-containing protein n=1 Tax=Phlebiopsis gigantea (strain 11061_1 CR5-6) TaxID=745531 RepID=A0A0C3S0Y4_PHLG1|nr:hypothetical protein PHLGIDRAFT_68979 [Phlebiopsis gigantea 11061_1 CR5-6]
MDVSAGAAWAVIRNGESRKGRFGCGKATPYDAEMAALARGLKEVLRDLPDGVKDAALTSILGAGSGPAQMLSVAACATVRPWLQQSEERRIHMHWTPGHRGVYWNGVVDRDAGLATAEPSSEVSFALARQCVTAQAYAAWRDDMTKPNYRGRSNMLHHSQFDCCKHTAANWFLKTAGKDNTYFARLVRFTSGHFPHGAFRERFEFEGNRRCWCGECAVESRDHIWFDCELWIRKHRPPDDELERRRRGEHRRDALDLVPPTPPGMSSVEHFLQDWRDSPVNIDQVAEFLQLNPAAATFQWLELVDRAYADRDGGAGETVNTYKADLHTRVRRDTYEGWVRRNPTCPVAVFNEKYARVAADKVRARFGLPDEEILSLRVEFGMSVRAARELQAKERAGARGADSDG